MAAMPFRLPPEMNALVVHDITDQKRLGAPVDTAIEKWEQGGYPSEPGRYEELNIYERGEVLIENGYGQLLPSTLTVSFMVKQTLYYGHIPIEQLSGFKDELSGSIITNAFTIGMIDPNVVENSWTPLKSADELPTPVLLRLTGLIGYER
jgi:hypothetical protein